MNACLILLAAALSAGNAEFDETAKSGAFGIAFERAKAELVSAGPAEGELAKRMLADPAKYQSAEKAKAASAADYRELVAAELAQRRAEIAGRLGLDQPGDAALSAEETRRAEAKFGERFAAERKVACDAQARTIVSATRPTEAEFEAKEDWELRETIAARVVKEQKSPVFQENLRLISERVVEPLIKGARDEQRRQGDYVAHARSDAAAPSKLAADLKRRLARNVEDRRAKAEDPSAVWGLFEKTAERAAAETAERRTLDRLERRVDDVRLEIDAESVGKEIASDLPAHLSAAKSEKIFRERYAVRVLADALEAACASAPEDERAEVREFLGARLASNPVAKAVESKIRKDVLPKWRAARAAAADRLAEATWPTLKDGSWYPDAELADTLLARSDCDKAVRGWRQVSGMETLAKASGGKPMLEEADAAADAAVAAAFGVARSALLAQNAIVETSCGPVLAASRARKDSLLRRTPNLKEITAMLTEATEKAWDEKRETTLWPDGKAPANAAEQHRELFPSVRRKIELMAKVILEEMNQPKPEEEKKPEEPPPEPQVETPEEKPPEEAEYPITVRRSGGEIEVSLESGGSTLESSTVPAKKDDFENAMFKVTKSLSEQILKLK